MVLKEASSMREVFWIDSGFADDRSNRAFWDFMNMKRDDRSLSAVRVRVDMVAPRGSPEYKTQLFQLLDDLLRLERQLRRHTPCVVRDVLLVFAAARDALSRS